MFDIVCIGNATHDVFVELDQKKRGNCIVLPCGSKQEVKSIFHATGGGATNTAVAFAKLGLKTAILVAVGKDNSANSIISELRHEKVDPSLIVKMPNRNTAYSAIITGRGIDRIILSYGGATSHLSASTKINWAKLAKSRWFYVSSFHSKPGLLKKIFEFAAKKGISIAWNPGKSELKQGMKKLAPLIKKADILFLNTAEAEMLTGKKQTKQNMTKLQKLAKLVVVTAGKKGSFAFDGSRHYASKVHKIKVVDNTGAGDAFNSGFLTAILWGKSIKKGLELGTRNAEAILVAKGAKNNLLNKSRAKKYA